MGRSVNCPTCGDSGRVSDPWLESDQDFPCPECRMEEYQSSDEFFAVSDGLRRHRTEGERLGRAEAHHLNPEFPNTYKERR